MSVIRREDLDFDPDDEIEILYCPMCLKVGLNIVLGSKILMPNEPRPVDYENWLQCARCRYLCPIYEAVPEEAMTDAVTTINNPFEETKGYFEGIYRGSKRKRKKKHDAHDKDIAQAIKQHGENNVHIIQGR
jgi:hypothetical protein